MATVMGKGGTDPLRGAGSDGEIGCVEASPVILLMAWGYRNKTGDEQRLCRSKAMY